MRVLWGMLQESLDKHDLAMAERQSQRGSSPEVWPGYVPEVNVGHAATCERVEAFEHIRAFKHEMIQHVQHSGPVQCHFAFTVSYRDTCIDTNHIQVLTEPTCWMVQSG